MNNISCQSVGIYARLSVRSTGRKEMSIDNQLLLAGQYLDRYIDCQHRKIYVDYGYSGTTFQRPGFQRMIEDCRVGLLDAVVAKDLSRLGREHLQLGWYLECFFPANHVRVITVTDHYDSAKLTEQMLAAGLKNLLNEWYAVETGYKVRMAKRQQKEEGNFIGAKAPYGYRICFREGKRVLEPDQTFCILVDIQNMRREGLSSVQIAHKLNEEHVATPEIYRRTGFLRLPQDQETAKWSGAMVRGIWNREIVIPDSNTSGDNDTA